MIVMTIVQPICLTIIKKPFFTVLIMVLSNLACRGNTNSKIISMMTAMAIAIIRKKLNMGSAERFTVQM